jgi:hypothetical protein
MNYTYKVIMQIVRLKRLDRVSSRTMTAAVAESFSLRAAEGCVQCCAGVGGICNVIAIVGMWRGISRRRFSALFLPTVVSIMTMTGFIGGRCSGV